MSFRTTDLFLFVATLGIALAIASQCTPAYTLLIMSFLMLSTIPFVSPVKRRFYVYGSIFGVILLPTFSYFFFDLIVNPPPRSPKQPPGDYELAYENAVSYLVAAGLLFGGWIGILLGVIQQRHEIDTQIPKQSATVETK